MLQIMVIINSYMGYLIVGHLYIILNLDYLYVIRSLDLLINKRIHKASANIGCHEHNNEEVNVVNLTFLSTLTCEHIKKFRYLSIYNYINLLIFELTTCKILNKD